MKELPKHLLSVDIVMGAMDTKAHKKSPYHHMVHVGHDFISKILKTGLYNHNNKKENVLVRAFFCILHESRITQQDN